MAGLADWFVCPECESQATTHHYTNGRLSVVCDDCGATSSQLVGTARLTRGRR